MEKKFLSNKKFILLSLMLLGILSFVFYVYSSDINTAYYNKGLDINKLLEDCRKDPSYCQDLTRNVNADFLQGILDSIDEKKVGGKENAEKNLEKLTELWLRREEFNENGKKVIQNSLDDKSKNKIMEMLSPEQKNDFLKKIANTAFWQFYGYCFHSNLEGLLIYKFFYSKIAIHKCSQEIKTKNINAQNAMALSVFIIKNAIVVRR